MPRVATLMLLTALLAMGVGPTFAGAQDKGDKTDSRPLQERLPPKIQKIQEEMPAWLKKTGNKEGLALMKKMHEQIEAKQYEEVEKTADAILKLIGVSAAEAGLGGDKKPGKPQADSPEETTKRLTGKVERISDGAQRWAASGKDASEIAKIMEEEFQPLMQAGKIVEAEAVLDRMLKLLGMESKPSASPNPQGQTDEERLLTRIHRIQKELPAWIKKTGKQAEADALMQKLKKQLADMNFAEAEQTANSILAAMGISIEPEVPAAKRPVAANDFSDADDPFSAFLPQQIVFLASEQIALTKEQGDALRTRVNKAQPRLKELQVALEQETAALAALMSQDQVDEAATLAQLDKFLDIEREAKRLNVGLGVTIQNLLNSEQEARLRELLKDQDAIAKLEQQFSQRIMAKVERVNAGAQKWAESGRDPSAIAQIMDEKVRPLMETERVFEAEAELDRVLELLDKDAK